MIKVYFQQIIWNTNRFYNYHRCHCIWKYSENVKTIHKYVSHILSSLNTHNSLLSSLYACNYARIFRNKYIIWTFFDKFQSFNEMQNTIWHHAIIWFLIVIDDGWIFFFFFCTSNSINEQKKKYISKWKRDVFLCVIEST